VQKYRRYTGQEQTVAIPPGSYTKDTLPPISPEARAILDRAKAQAEKSREEGRATSAGDSKRGGARVRGLRLDGGKRPPGLKLLEKRPPPGIDPDWLGEALGATGYPRKKKRLD